MAALFPRNLMALSSSLLSNKKKIPLFSRTALLPILSCTDTTFSSNSKKPVSTSAPLPISRRFRSFGSFGPVLYFPSDDDDDDDDDDEEVANFSTDTYLDPRGRFFPGSTLVQSVSMKEVSGMHAREDEEAFYVLVDMPGFSKEHVKVILESNNVVTIKAEANEEWGTVVVDGAEDGKIKKRVFNERIHLVDDDEEDEGYLELEKMRAEMKNGLLMLKIPKVKKEEEEMSKEVLEVAVE